MYISKSKCKVSKYPDLGLTRICNYCGKVLPLTHDYFPIFNPTKDIIYGYYRKNCKECHSFRVIEKGFQKRAVYYGLPADLTRNQWNETKMYFNDSCAYCGEKSEKTLLMEHLNGDAYTQCNILPSCKSCNSSKRDANLFEWYIDDKKLKKLNRERLVKIFNFLTLKQKEVEFISKKEDIDTATPAGIFMLTVAEQLNNLKDLIY